MNKQKQHKPAVADQNSDKGEGTPIEVPTTTYQLPTETIHDATLVWVTGIGTHLSRYGKRQQDVIFTFELTDETAVFNAEKGEEPFVLSIFFNLTLGRGSNLRKSIARWRGEREIEIVRHNLGLLLGKLAQVNVTLKEDKETGQVKARILQPILPPRRGVKATVPVTPLLQYAISDGTGGVFNQLPDWIQKKILASEELNGKHATKAEIAERNMRQATANAIAESEPDESDEDEEPEVFDLDAYSDEDLRKSEGVTEIREIIDNLPCSNAEKVNQFRYLNQLVRRAKAHPSDPDDTGDDDNVVPL